MWYESFTNRLPREEGLTPLGEIAAALKQAYGGEELPPGQIPGYRPMHLCNALHTPENEERLHLPEDRLRVRGIRLPQTAGYRSREAGRETDPVYLAYEEQTGYVYSNSNALFLEVQIARGYTRRDREEQTERYQVWRKALARREEEVT